MLALALITACAEPVARPTSPPLDASFARSSSDLTATWKIPLADDGLALRSDGQFSDGSYSVYENGVCDVETKIFASTTGSGDATLRSQPRGNRCRRLFELSYPDGQTEMVWSFANLLNLQNSTFSIPVGSTVRRRFLFNPEVVNSPSRCGRLVFGPNPNVGAGTDSVTVTRIDARTWEVQSQPAPNNRALCESTGAIYAMPVSFVIVASRDLP
jgi:hypothetical protein